MPSTVERPPAANVVAHATEYAPDRDQRGQGEHRKDSNESDAQRHADETGSVEETPAVLLEPHHLDDHLLDGVAAYRAAAHHVLDPNPEKPASTPRESSDPRAADAVRHAYEDHGGEVEEHSVNVAT